MELFTCMYIGESNFMYSDCFFVFLSMVHWVLLETKLHRDLKLEEQ